MKKKYIVMAIIYIILVAICAFMVYAVPSIKGLLVKTYIAEQGKITLDDEVDVYIVRDEESYTATKDGEVKRLAKAGKLYKSGTKIVDFKDKEGSAVDKNCYSKHAGYVVYYTDGAEDKFKPDKIKKIKKAEYENIGNLRLCAKGDIKQGKSMYKIVRNGRLHLVFFVKKAQAKKYIVGNSVQVKIANETIKGHVDSVTKGKVNARIVVKSSSMFNGCLRNRKEHCEVIAASSTGLIIHNESIVKKKGKLGVIVKDKMGNYNFKRICIKADDGEQSVVYQDVFMDNSMNFVETLKIYDEVLEKPSEDQIKESE